jgi:glycosyltransferase involved in cell wall biosynthesis
MQQRYGYRVSAVSKRPGSRGTVVAGCSDSSGRPAQPFVVRYVGSIVPDGQKESLRDIAQAVAEMRAAGRQIELRIHSPQRDTEYLRSVPLPSGAIRIEGPPESSIVPRLLAESDLLLLPYNFDARSARYIRLSLPTKAPAYMISGTPVLVYAPADVATARYATREAWGYVVATRGEEAVMSAVRTLMQHTSLREQLGRRAREVAVARHDASVVKAAFWTALCEAPRQRGA